MFFRRPDHPDSGFHFRVETQLEQHVNKVRVASADALRRNSSVELATHFEYQNLKRQIFTAFIGVIDVSRQRACQAIRRVSIFARCFSHLAADTRIADSTVERDMLVGDLANNVAGYGLLDLQLVRDDISDRVVKRPNNIFIKLDGRIVSQFGRRVDHSPQICDLRLHGMITQGNFVIAFLSAMFVTILLRALSLASTGLASPSAGHRSESKKMAEEFENLLAKLLRLPEWRKAYENLATRTDIVAVKSATTILMQTEKYGSPISMSQRVLGRNSRDARLPEAEENAMAPPSNLTVAMIIFFLPVLVVVIIPRAMIQIMRMM